MTDQNRTAKPRDRAAAVLKAFPLPSQHATPEENYRRVLQWLYGRIGAAALIIDLDLERLAPTRRIESQDDYEDYHGR